MEVRSRRYGTRTMFDTAGNHQPEDYFTTTTRASFLSPAKHDKPNWRDRTINQAFDNAARLIVAKRAYSHVSGYHSNRQLHDEATAEQTSCKICGVRKQSARRLREHVERFHMKIKLYACKICDASNYLTQQIHKWGNRILRCSRPGGGRGGIGQVFLPFLAFS